MTVPFQRAQTPEHLAEIDRHPMPVVARATDYPAGHAIAAHAHAKAQLIHAVHGVMVVSAPGGQWIVPPTRGLWMPCGFAHAIRCIGVVRMRSVWVSPDVPVALAPPGGGATGRGRKSGESPRTVAITPLLRELIEAATRIASPYDADSREGRLTRLLLDELQALPELPMHLPQPADARLRRICARIARRPDDASTLGDWAARLAVDVKTLQRLFARETGMTFGQWRQQSRLLHGLEQLARGDKVVDVALALGYDSPSAFAAMFRRQFGQTPSGFFR